MFFASGLLYCDLEPHYLSVWQMVYISRYICYTITVMTSTSTLLCAVT